MTTRVVFAWELGTYLGHLERDLAVALRLRQLGADVQFIVANLKTAEELLSPAGFSFVPSPALQRPARRPKTPVNFSDVLLDAGYDDAAGLCAAVRAWSALWKLISPDVIVTDFAPTAILSARLAGIRTLPLGAAFSVPPDSDPMPAFRSDLPRGDSALRAADRKVLTVINQVAKALGCGPLETVGSLFRNSSAQVTCFPELDTYGTRSNVQYVGPISSIGHFVKTHWTRTGDTRVFAYLQPGIVGLEAILGGLRAPGFQAICVIPGARESLVARYRNEAMRIFTEPVELEELLPAADAVVSYGSAGIVSSSLRAGVPLLLFPKFLEQQLNSVRAASLGGAIIYPGVPTKPKVEAALHALQSNRSYGLAAQAFSRKYRNYRHEAAIDAVAEAIVKMDRELH